jgi:hypothetical protein
MLLLLFVCLIPSFPPFVIYLFSYLVFLHFLRSLCSGYSDFILFVGGQTNLPSHLEQLFSSSKSCVCAATVVVVVIVVGGDCCCRLIPREENLLLFIRYLADRKEQPSRFFSFLLLCAKSLFIFIQSK